ncbi:MAG: Fic family protein [Candidatus Krumholzibacteriia bacterium]
MDQSEGHSWPSFQVDLKAAAPQFWLLLGEAQARCSQISGASLRPGAAEEIGRIQTARFLLAGAAIAGNTITDDEVYRHLDRRLDPAPARRALPPTLVALLSARTRILEAVAGGERSAVTPELLTTLNRLALAGAPTGEPGAARREAPPAPEADDPRAAEPPSDDIPELLARLCDWLNAPRPGPPLVVAIMKAFLAHLHVAWIRPFADGNGRTARLVELHVLAHAGVPPPAVALPLVFHARDREEYFRQIARARRSPAGPVNFVQHSTLGFVEELRDLEASLGARQREATWRHHVEAAFGDSPGKAGRRQKQLLLDLGAAGGPVATSRARAAGPDTARAYLNLNEKTVRRDLSELAARGLVERVQGGWRARRESLAPWARG